MPYTTLIAPEDLFPHLKQPGWVVIDCRFRLTDTDFGRRAYAEGHLPGAVYAHLDDDLSGPVVPGRTGRHPLPEPEVFAARLSAWGIGNATQVVAYDDLGGAIASRLWWMLRWLGHEAVAVLDGGWPTWTDGGYPVEATETTPAPVTFTASPHPNLLVDAETVDAVRVDPSHRLIDARAAERYRGEHEPIDPIAGHIPGALNAPFKENLTELGTFLPTETLAARYTELLGDTAPTNAVVYCGSGVTACHNLLAMAHAGLDGARLYPGSWSEWIINNRR